MELVVLAWVAFAFLSAWIARQKWRSETEGCVLGCLFGPFGCIIEALLPTLHLPPPVPRAVLTDEQLAQAVAREKLDREEAQWKAEEDRKRRLLHLQERSEAALARREWFSRMVLRFGWLYALPEAIQPIAWGCLAAIPAVAVLVWMFRPPTAGPLPLANAALPRRQAPVQAERIPAAPALEPDSETPHVPGMMPEVAEFLGDHPDFGVPSNARNLTNWAEGKLQRIDFVDGRSLAFYEMGGKIVTVWDRSPGAEDKPIFGEPYEPPGFVPVDKPPTADVPAYRVAFAMKTIDGIRVAEIIIPSMSRATAVEDRANVARAIAKRENLDEVHLFSTEEARKASTSESYASQHPEARRGSLGFLKDWAFTSTETLGL